MESRHGQVSNWETNECDDKFFFFRGGDLIISSTKSKLFPRSGNLDTLTNGHLSGRCCTGSTLGQLTFPINNRLNNPLSAPPHLLATRIPSTSQTNLHVARTCCSSCPFLDSTNGMKNNYGIDEIGSKNRFSWFLKIK